MDLIVECSQRISQHHGHGGGRAGPGGLRGGGHQRGAVIDDRDHDGIACPGEERGRGAVCGRFDARWNDLGDEARNCMYFPGLEGDPPRPLADGAFPTVVVPYRAFTRGQGSQFLDCGGQRTAVVGLLPSNRRARRPCGPSRLCEQCSKSEEPAYAGADPERRFQRSAMCRSGSETLGAAGIPCSPVMSFAEVVEDPSDANPRDVSVDRLSARRAASCDRRAPIKLSETPARIGAPAPELGEHTGKVLAELLEAVSGCGRKSRRDWWRRGRRYAGLGEIRECERKRKVETNLRPLAG